MNAITRVKQAEQVLEYARLRAEEKSLAQQLKHSMATCAGLNLEISVFSTGESEVVLDNDRMEFLYRQYEETLWSHSLSS